jgi:hypothetical protein
MTTKQLRPSKGQDLARAAFALNHGQAPGMGLIVELGHPNAARLVQLTVKSRDGRANVALARGVKAWGLVLGGALHRHSAGCIAVILPAYETRMLEMAIRTVRERLRELGWNCSIWTVLAAEARQREIESMLARMDETANHALL